MRAVCPFSFWCRCTILDLLIQKIWILSLRREDIQVHWDTQAANWHRYNLFFYGTVPEGPEQGFSFLCFISFYWFWRHLLPRWIINDLHLLAFVHAIPLFFHSCSMIEKHIVPVFSSNGKDYMDWSAIFSLFSHLYKFISCQLFLLGSRGLAGCTGIPLSLISFEAVTSQ